MPRLAAARSASARVRGACLLFITAALAIGCGGGAGATPSPAPSKTFGPPTGTLCDLISIEQAIAATGGLSLVTVTALPDDPGCVYQGGDGSAVVGFQFVDEAYWDQIESDQHLKLDLGDDANWVADDQTLILVVRDATDRFAVVVQMPRGSPKPALEVARAMAKYLLARA